MRSRYDYALKSIGENFAKMGEYYESVFDQYLLYIENRDQSIIDEIIENEDYVYRTVMEIEDKCGNLILTQQPVATDLRFIQSSIRIVSCYKKIYSHIVEGAIIIKHLDLTDAIIDIVKQFINLNKAMFSKAINAFVNKDKDLSYNTIKDDEEIDKLFKETIDKLVEITTEKKLSAMELADYVLFFKYFERIGDRCVRICKLSLEI